MNEEIFRFSNIKKNYFNKAGKIQIFKDLNFSIIKNSITAIVGPSGSGKSTLLHILALIEKFDNGEIVLDNKIKYSTTNSKEQENIKKNLISIIFQNNNLLEEFSAEENVIIPLMIRGSNTKESINGARNILKKFGLGDRLNNYPNQLSGGEQQRVAIARSVVSNTEVLLADEPTGNLDHKTSLEIFKYFIELKKLGKSIIFATHNRELADMADYKLKISEGSIISDT